jgi:kelch-like protein 2/3
MHRAEIIRQTYNITFSAVLSEVHPPSPPWHLPNVSHCTELFHIKKNQLSTEEVKAIFLDHRNAHSECYSLYTDGSKSEDGTRYAYVGDDVLFSRRIQGEASIYSAELLAIYDAIGHADSLLNHDNIVIYTDSRSAIQGITKYQQKNPLVQLVQSRIANSTKNINLCWVPSHVGILQNEQADALARDVVLATDPDPTQIPRSDHKNIIRNAVKHRWKQRWTNLTENKYREISNSITPLPHALSSIRSWSITLTRLRIWPYYSDPRPLNGPIPPSIL